MSGGESGDRLRQAAAMSGDDRCPVHDLGAPSEVATCSCADATPVTAGREQDARETLARVPLADLLAAVRPGSNDWTWDDEQSDLDARVCCCCDQPGHYQAALEDYLRGVGRIEQGVCLGNDGRVWDGHHRIVAARRLGFPDIPLEDESYPLPEVTR